MDNSRGGALGLQVSGDSELKELILSCISYNESHLVKSDFHLSTCKYTK